MADSSTLKKITLYSQILVILLVFVLMISASYLFTSKIEQEHLQEDARTALYDMQINVESNFQEAEVVLGSFAETIRLLILRRDADFASVSRYISDLPRYLSAKEKFESYVLDIFGVFDVFDNKMAVAFGKALPDDYVYTERPWYKAAIEANGATGVTHELFLDAVTNVYTITFVRRIFDDAGNPLGIVGLNLKFDRIKERLSKISSKHFDFAILTDGQQRIIYYSNDYAHHGKMLREMPYGIAALAYDLEQGREVFEREILNHKNGKCITFFKEFNNGWHIGIGVQKKEYYKSITQLALFLGLIGIVCAAALIILLLKIARARDKAEERMRLMLDSVPMCANLLTKDAKHIDCNQEAVRLFGLTSKQEYMERFYEFSPEYQPDGVLSREKSIETVNRTIRDGYCRLEWLHQKLDGEQVPCEITLVRVKHNDSFIVAAYARDLRELKAASAQVHESKQSLNMLTNVLNGLDIMIYVTVPDTGEILFMNDYMKKHYNIKGDCVGEICYKILQEGMDKKCAFCPCYKLDKEPSAIIEWEERSTLTKRVYHNTDRYIQWHDGRTVHIQHSADLTELFEAKEHAEQASRFKSQFLSRMSHEIRTPINAILGATEIQLQNEILTPDAEKALMVINNSGELLLTIINNILDLSKIESNKMELVSSEYEISSLISDTVQLNMMRQSSNPIDFELNVDENTPSKLIGDEIRIKQVLNNLLSNAFKYTNEGSIKFSVSAENLENEAEATLIFCVSDTGRGMTKEQISRLFDEYSRFNLENNYSVEGTGLGMSITRNLVEIMGGKITVVSEPDKGSAFTVRLPQKRSCGAVLGREQSQNLTRFRMDKTALVKRAQLIREYMPYGSVLIVDDVESNLYVASGLMSPYGLSIDTAKSGFEAIDKVENGKVYDIIFMDHMMPGMDGIEAVKRIRALGYTHPVVALTANAVVGQAEVFLANGFQNFISKPIDVRVLNNVLDKMIRDKQPPEVIAEARKRCYLAKAMKQNSDTIDPGLLAVFIRDVKKVLPVIESITKTADNISPEDLRLFTINIHAMKSALAYVGENALSAAAAKLETAARDGDTKIVSEETPSFLSGLNSLVQKFTLAEEEDHNACETEDENPELLVRQLSAFKSACVDYNNIEAKNILNELSANKWSRRTKELLAALSDHLLNGGFEEAAQRAQEYGDKDEQTAKTG